MYRLRRSRKPAPAFRVVRAFLRRHFRLLLNNTGAKQAFSGAAQRAFRTDLQSPAVDRFRDVRAAGGDITRDGGDVVESGTPPAGESETRRRGRWIRRWGDKTSSSLPVSPSPCLLVSFINSSRLSIDMLDPGRGVNEQRPARLAGLLTEERILRQAAGRHEPGLRDLAKDGRRDEREALRDAVDLAGRQGRRGDKETGRQGEGESSCLLISVSPCLPVSSSPCLGASRYSRLQSLTTIADPVRGSFRCGYHAPTTDRGPAFSRTAHNFSNVPAGIR